MRIRDLLIEHGTSDVKAVLEDIKDRLPTLTSAEAFPQDYINQIGLRFKLYANDPMPCTVYLQLKGGNSARKEADAIFRKRIISAALSVTSSRTKRPGALPSYDHAARILRGSTIGRRAIAVLTNPEVWELVDFQYDGIKWRMGKGTDGSLAVKV